MNKLVLGDNLEVLRGLPSESVDLIYLDPPFFSNRHYECIWGDRGEIRSFEDRWSGGIEHYIAWLRERVQEMHRVLKSTGSLYLHCDHHADAYIRVYILDPIFGASNMRGHIIWQRVFAHNDAKHRLANLKDSIFYYSKSDSCVYAPQYQPYKQEYLDNFYKFSDERGPYQLITPTGPGLNPNDVEWRGYHPGHSGRHWSITRSILNRLVSPEQQRDMTQTEKLDLMYDNGFIDISSKGGVRFKLYLEADKGTILGDIWTDIAPVQGSSAERISYPTQKPEKLLERIIKASSNEGDIVLDPFVGGGTTVAVANRLGRNWIGIDQSAQAIRVSENRINNQGLTTPFEVVLHKYDYDDLFTMDPFKFESWIVQQFGGVPNVKQRGDLGLDGRTSNGTPIQVKQSEGIGRNVIDNLKSAAERYDRNRYQAAIQNQEPVAYLIAFSFGRGATQEVARLRLEQGIDIRLVRVDEIVQVAKKPVMHLSMEKTELEDGRTSVVFEVRAESATSISFFSWDWDYEQDSRVFKPEVQIDTAGKQTRVFAPGEYTIAVKAVDEDGLETLGVHTLIVEG